MASHGSAPDGTNGTIKPEMPYLSTQPSPDQDWKLTLKDKVIAITGVCYRCQTTHGRSCKAKYGTGK